MNRTPRRRLFGFSIVELMVALLLGSLVVLAVARVFISNREAYQVSSNMELLMANSRFATDILSYVVRLNGYQGNSANEWVLGPLTGATLGGAPPLAGTNDDSAASDSDTLTITYRGTSDNCAAGASSCRYTKDCLGNDVAATDLVMNRFWVDDSSGTSVLRCDVSRDSGGTWTSEVLINGVEAMHILYGEDTTGDDSANRYVTTGTVGSMDDVVAVRISLLLATRDDGVAIDTDNNAYSLLDALVHSAADAPGDQRIRRVMTQTINLRNHL